MTERWLLRDAWEQVLAPALPELLPGSLGHALRRRLSRSPRLYIDAIQAASDAAQRHGFLVDADTNAWQQAHRVCRLLDLGDALVGARLRRRGWPQRMRVDGSWPPSGQPFVGVSFHFGTGCWALAHLRDHGTPAAFLAQRYDRSSYPGRPLSYWSARRREAGVRRAGGTPVIFTGGSVSAMRAALAEDKAVIGLIDTPSVDARHTLRVPFGERHITLPTGLIEVASAAGVPVVPFEVIPDTRDGSRQLRIGQPLDPGDPQAVLTALAARLYGLLHEAPEAWYFWEQLPALLAGDG